VNQWPDVIIGRRSAVRTMLKSKIHRARITGVNIDYEGSITIDKDLIRQADILPYEQVLVLDINNGARFTTYAIEGERGEICVNGAAARLVAPQDLVIILSFCQVEDEVARNWRPRLVYVNAANAVATVGH